MENPKVSIIIASFNRAHLIDKTLNSILNQSFKEWECIIIDDGSIDNTEEVVKSIVNNDTRFKFLSRDIAYKKGLPGCRNQGLDIAKGSYIIFFDDDDLVHPENLQTCVSQFTDPQIKFCRYDKKPFTNKGKLVVDNNQNSKTQIFDLSQLDKMITGEIPFASCCIMWRRECFIQDRFNEKLMYAEEWECYSRILSRGIKGISINSVLYYNRKHQLSNTGEFRRQNPIRLNSQIIAGILVIENLMEKDLFNEDLKKFFVRMALELKSGLLLKMCMKASGANKLERLKYKLGYKIYPLLKPIFYLKGQILRH